MTTEQQQMDSLLNQVCSVGSATFRPCAYLDARLDCIRVVVRDCSVTERRINSRLTVLVDNYAAERRQSQWAGFTLKGAQHFCNEYGLSLKAPMKITALIDAMLKSAPDTATELFLQYVAPMLVRDARIEEVEVPLEPAMA